jgi:hypothetical protein
LQEGSAVPQAARKEKIPNVNCNIRMILLLSPSLRIFMINCSPLSFGEKKAAERNAREIELCYLKTEMRFSKWIIVY